jgi:hypothetical protein
MCSERTRVTKASVPNSLIRTVCCLTQTFTEAGKCRQSSENQSLSLASRVVF